MPIVQVNMGRVQNWDTHSGNFKTLKDDCCRRLDRGVSALLDDLARRRACSTRRWWSSPASSAGRPGSAPSTGNANAHDGRDHWAACFSVAFAGAGVRGGQMIGQSDKIGAYPASRPYSPGDFAATIYERSGSTPRPSFTTARPAPDPALYPARTNRARCSRCDHLRSAPELPPWRCLGSRHEVCRDVVVVRELTDYSRPLVVAARQSPFTGDSGTACGGCGSPPAP